jgi:hypothetical protein
LFVDEIEQRIGLRVERRGRGRPGNEEKNASPLFWQKVHRVGGAYAGLALDGLKSKHRHKVLAGFGKVNSILACYTLNSFDDYEQIKDEDLREMLRIVRSLAPPK